MCQTATWLLNCNRRDWCTQSHVEPAPSEYTIWFDSSISSSVVVRGLSEIVVYSIYIREDSASEATQIVLKWSELYNAQLRIMSP